MRRLRLKLAQWLCPELWVCYQGLRTWAKHVQGDGMQDPLGRAQVTYHQAARVLELNDAEGPWC